MKKWDGVPPLPCWDGHLLVANQGGWGMLCYERPERWQTMEGHPTDEPLIIPNEDQPSCEVCKLLLDRNEVEKLTKQNWPIEWVKVSC